MMMAMEVQVLSCTRCWPPPFDVQLTIGRRLLNPAKHAEKSVVCSSSKGGENVGMWVRRFIDESRPREAPKRRQDSIAKHNQIPGFRFRPQTVRLETLAAVSAASFFLNCWWKISVKQNCNKFASLGLMILSGQTKEIPAKIKWSIAHLFYLVDVALEKHPTSYLMLLGTTCVVLIILGGFAFYLLRTRKQPLSDCLWEAWSCLINSSSHLKESTGVERATGFALAIGGIMFYSLLISTLTMQFRSRMEILREGALFDIMETNHTIICGANDHLPTLLKQLNKSQYLRKSSRKQTIVLLSENMKNSRGAVVNVCKECKALNILQRSGSLSDTSAFQAVGAASASRVIFLSKRTDTYEADADVVLSVLALQPLRDQNPEVQLIAEVSTEGSAELLKSLAGTNVTAVPDLSSKLLVQCSRQQGLIDVYQELLDPGRQIISLRTYPALTGYQYRDVRRGFQEGVVCGIIRNNSIDFHPKDTFVLENTDKLIVISEKDKAQEFQKLSMIDRQFLSEANNIVRRSTKPLSKIEWNAPRKEYIIILGWRSSVREMVAEYDDYVGRGSELLILAKEPLKNRQLPITNLKNIKVMQKVGNPLNEEDLKNALQACKSKYKEALSIVVIIDEKWQPEKCDKQSIYALLLAESVCNQLEVKVASLIGELVDTKLGKHVAKSHDALKFIGTSELMGLVIAQVSENMELNDIWTDLLNSSGDEIYVKDIALYMKDGEKPSFQELSDRAVLRDEVAIGYRMKNKVLINPAAKSTPLSFSPGDSLVVISEFEYKQINITEKKQRKLM